MTIISTESSNQTEDDGIRALEKKAAEAELYWLLNSHFPNLLSDLAVNLEEALEATSSVDNIPATSNLSNLAISTVNSDAVKGVVTIEGPRITKGEFRIKLPKLNRGYILKIAIDPAKPVFLEQIQTARNFVMTARENLLSYLPPYSKHNFNELCDKLDFAVQRANQAISHTIDLKMFPQKVLPPGTFIPDLPEDLFIQFHVHRNFLVATFINIQPLTGHSQQFSNQKLNQISQAVEKQILHSKLLLKKSNVIGAAGLSHVRDSSSGISNPSLIPSGDRPSLVNLPDGRIAEILQEIVVESPCPRFGHLVRSLNLASEILVEMKLKLHGF